MLASDSFLMTSRSIMLIEPNANDARSRAIHGKKIFGTDAA
jgi:hypothetical protein